MALKQRKTQSYWQKEVKSLGKGNVITKSMACMTPHTQLCEASKIEITETSPRQRLQGHPESIRTLFDISADKNRCTVLLRTTISDDGVTLAVTTVDSSMHEVPRFITRLPGNVFRHAIQFYRETYTFEIWQFPLVARVGASAPHFQRWSIRLPVGEESARITKTFWEKLENGLKNLPHNALAYVNLPRTLLSSRGRPLRSIQCGNQNGKEYVAWSVCPEPEASELTKRRWVFTGHMLDPDVLKICILFLGGGDGEKEKKAADPQQGKKTQRQTNKHVQQAVALPETSRSDSDEVFIRPSVPKTIRPRITGRQTRQTKAAKRPQENRATKSKTRAKPKKRN